MDLTQRAQRLKQARQACGYRTAAEAADAFGWNRNTYASNENGNAPFSYKKAKAYGQAFGVSAVWLYGDAAGPHSPPDDTKPSRQTARTEPALVPIVGRVGADSDGIVVFDTAQSAGDLVPTPPGGGKHAVALLVCGHAMRGLADDGALIYFEDQRAAPTQDMFGHVVVLETDVGEVLVKRLLRGSRHGLYDLESLAGPTRHDARLRWAAHITAIIPPFQARRIIRTAGP